MAVGEGVAMTTAIKAGWLALIVAAISDDLDLLMVILVGTAGGLIFFFKEYTHLTVKTTKLKAFAEFMVTIPMAISTAGAVFYFGTKGINQYLDFGSAMWIFLALMASLHYKNVVKFFTSIGKIVINKMTEKKL